MYINSGAAGAKACRCPSHGAVSMPFRWDTGTRGRTGLARCNHGQLMASQSQALLLLINLCQYAIFTPTSRATAMTAQAHNCMGLGLIYGADCRQLSARGAN